MSVLECMLAICALIPIAIGGTRLYNLYDQAYQETKTLGGCIAPIQVYLMSGPGHLNTNQELTKTLDDLRNRYNIQAMAAYGPNGGTPVAKSGGPDPVPVPGAGTQVWASMQGGTTASLKVAGPGSRNSMITLCRDNTPIPACNAGPGEACVPNGNPCCSSGNCVYAPSVSGYQCQAVPPTSTPTNTPAGCSSPPLQCMNQCEGLNGGLCHVCGNNPLCPSPNVYICGDGDIHSTCDGQVFSTGCEICPPRV